MAKESENMAYQWKIWRNNGNIGEISMCENKALMALEKHRKLKAGVKWRHRKRKWRNISQRENQWHQPAKS
jgi:hypothetical protein